MITHEQFKFSQTNGLGIILLARSWAIKCLLSCLFVLLAGCNQGNRLPPVQLTDPIPALATATFANSGILPVTASPVPVQATTVPASTKSSSTAAKTPAPVGSLLQLTSPKDESIVNVSKLVIVGQTLPDAVVSVDGNLANIDTTGKFQSIITLDEGANIIEIVASDNYGNEQDMILRVIFEP